MSILTYYVKFTSKKEMSSTSIRRRGKHVHLYFMNLFIMDDAKFTLKSLWASLSVTVHSGVIVSKLVFKNELCTSFKICQVEYLVIRNDIAWIREGNKQCSAIPLAAIHFLKMKGVYKISIGQTYPIEIIYILV